MGYKNAKRLVVFFIALYFMFYVLVPNVIFAQNPANNVIDVLSSPAGDKINFPAFIGDLYKFAYGISGIIAVGMIVFGAIYYTTSGDSPQRANEGKDYIFSALWGLGLLAGSYLILNTINPQLVDLSIVKFEGKQKIFAVKCANATSGNYPNGTKKVGVIVKADSLEEAKLSGEILPNETDPLKDENLWCVLPIQPKICNGIKLDWENVIYKGDNLSTAVEKCLKEKGKEKVDVGSSKNFIVPKCDGWGTRDCSKGSQGWDANETKELGGGSVVYRYAYYQKGGEPENDARCVIYAYKTKDGDKVKMEKAKLDGLLKC